MTRRGQLTRIRLDMFLHVTLGGFAEETGPQNPLYHPPRLRAQLEALTRASRPLPYGTWPDLVERWGRSVNSLRATASRRRRLMREAA